MIDAASVQLYHFRVISILSSRLKSYWFSFGFFVIFIVLYLAILAMLGISRPPWGDEEHFIQTIRQFGQGITLDVLRTYSEMTTPLSFILYAAWGKLFSFDLATLRYLSLIIAMSTAITFWQLCYKYFRDPFSASICSIFLFINPYMVGFSLFVFPDMLTILCLIVAALATLEEKPVLLGIACTSGLLSRQYFVFFPLAVFIYSAYNAWRKKPKKLKPALAVMLSTIPSLSLFWLWKGFSPQNSLRQLYLGYAFKFYPTALVLYVILLGVYLAPLVIWRWKKYYTELPIDLMALILSAVYILYPIKASAPSLNNGIETVGYLHRFLTMVFGPHSQWVLYALFLLSLPILIHLLIAWWNGFTRPNFSWLNRLAIILFLVIMPFSYLWWEKYFILVLPLVILEIYHPNSSEQQIKTPAPSLLS